MNKNGNKSAFGDSPIGHDGITERDWFATFAPPAPEWFIKLEMQRDRNNNPHGDYYKPPIREQITIEVQWRYKWADEMLKVRDQQ